MENYRKLFFNYPQIPSLSGLLCNILQTRLRQIQEVFGANFDRIRPPFSHISHSTIKPTKWTVRSAKTQISLSIHPVWSVFAVYSLGSWEPKVSSGEQQILWSDWADAQAGLNLCWEHKSFDDFVTLWLMWRITMVRWRLSCKKCNVFHTCTPARPPHTCAHTHTISNSFSIL